MHAFANGVGLWILNGNWDTMNASMSKFVLEIFNGKFIFLVVDASEW
jgi:hypothetical protein